MALTISRHAITWYLNHDPQTGVYINGDPWVVGPITITGIDPAPYFDGVHYRNGSMINPESATSAKQGFDSSATSWLQSKNVGMPNNIEISEANPLVVPTGSSLMSSKSRAGLNGARPQLSDVSILTVVSEPPPEGAFRPPYAWYNKDHLWTLANINYSALPRLTPPASASTYNALLADEKNFGRPWIEIALVDEAGRQIHPLNHQPEYGRDLAIKASSFWLHLCLDYSDAEKQPLLIRGIQYGLDLYGVCRGAGSQAQWSANGGLNGGRKLPLLMAGIMLNDPNILWYANKENHFRFQDDLQVFYVSTADMARGHEPHVACTSGSFDSPHTNITERWHMAAVCNNRSMSCARSSPDRRQRDVYMVGPETGKLSSSLLGYPEWGEKHASNPERDGSNWGVRYRDVNAPFQVRTALVGQLVPNARIYWNNQVYFDYADRAKQLYSDSIFGQFTVDMWSAYRTLGGPVWSPSSTPSGDTTPPTWVINSPSYNHVNASGFTILAQTDEPSVVFVGILPDEALAVASSGLLSSSGFLYHGSVVTTIGSQSSIIVTGLSPSTSYDVYLAARDLSQNLQPNPIKLDITTSASSVITSGPSRGRWFLGPNKILTNLF